MNGYLLNKEIIFFNPGISGVIFTHAAKSLITMEQLIKAQECLVRETLKPVIYIEDRRAYPRK